MPIVKIENIHEGLSWGLWKITEDADNLIESVPFNAAESVEFEKISNQKRQMEWLGARILLKTVLEHWGLPYLGLVKDTHDKPHLCDHKLYISLAHSYPYAAIILDKKNPCGIDIEKPKNTLHTIAHKFLNEKENTHIEGNLEKLCVTWAAKEVLYKIQGKKYLSFQKNMNIEPFDLIPSRVFRGTIRKDDIQMDYRLIYEIYDGHYICYNI